MQEIISHWRFASTFARDIGVKPGIAQKWKERDAIPAEYDRLIVVAAERRGYPISLDTLADLRAAKAGRLPITDEGFPHPAR